MQSLEKPLRVRILDREYALRISKEDEAHTIRIANYLDTKMRAFKSAHPEQSEVTTAVITALAVTEELFDTQTRGDAILESTEARLNALDELLADRLQGVPASE